MTAPPMSLSALPEPEAPRPTDPALDPIAWLAAQACATPQAYVGLLEQGLCRIRGRAFDGPGEPDAWPRAPTPCSGDGADGLLEIADTALHPLWRGPLPGPRAVRFCAGAPVHDPEGAVLGALFVVDEAPRRLSPAERDALRVLAEQASRMLELAQLRRRARPEALYDEASGAWSHEAFQRRLAEEWSRHARRGESLALMLLAPDGTDMAAGHESVLCRLLRAVGDSLRASDHLSRQPGQRFAVLLPGSGLGSAMNAAQRVRQAVERLAAEGTPGPGLCMGVAAMAPAPHGDPQQLLARAEHALRQAQAPGHARIQPFSGWQD